MSLAIEVSRVREILLPDGQWHEVIEGSFNTNAYEYVEGTKTVFGGGQAKETIPSTGATWKERDASGNERILFCPLTAILAISYGRASGKKSK